MASENEPGPLIAAAAKAALGPLGCRRIGRSRTWISDQRFWIIQIEFQPSGWSKGTYLNVGAAWLWYPRKGLPFNWGYRVADFIPFESAEQFAPLIVGMAARAAREVLALRETFRSFVDIHRNLMTRVSRDGWPDYHAAVAAGLVGDIGTSRRLFLRFDQWATSPQWTTKPKSESLSLAALLDEPTLFKTAIVGIIEQCRVLNKLPSDPHCLDLIDTELGRR